VSRILVVTAVEAEARAVADGLDAQPATLGRYPALRATTGAGEVTVVAGGLGMAASAAATATALALADWDFVVSAGIGGGFDGRAAVGEVVLATDVLACQLGADSPDGFSTFGELGLVDTGIATGAPVAPLAARLGARTGTVLTVCTVTGTDERAVAYAERWQPVAEAMEGWGVWSTAAAAGSVVPYELRAISNRVGRRDRNSWDIAGALDALAAATRTMFSSRLDEEPVP
jgi:futalosine hydrolase